MLLSILFKGKPLYIIFLPLKYFLLEYKKEVNSPQSFDIMKKKKHKMHSNHKTKQQCYENHINENDRYKRKLIVEIVNTFHLSSDYLFPPICNPALSIKHNSKREMATFCLLLFGVYDELKKYCEMAYLVANLYMAPEDVKHQLISLYSQYSSILGNCKTTMHRNYNLYFTYCVGCRKFFDIQRLLETTAERMAEELLLDGSLSKENVLLNWRNFVCCPHCPLGGQIMPNTVMYYDHVTKKLYRQWCEMPDAAASTAAN